MERRVDKVEMRELSGMVGYTQKCYFRREEIEYDQCSQPAIFLVFANSFPTVGALCEKQWLRTFPWP